MSADTEANHHRRLVALETRLDGLDDFIKVLTEEPNPKPPEPINCRDCGSKNTESKLGEGVFSDSVAHRCKSCDHSWRVPIKDENPPDEIEEKRAAAAKADADASFREVGLDPEAIDAARAADDEYDARVRELEAKCPDSVLGPPQVYQIAYRTMAGAKPTFVHVRAESAIRALMAFIDETSRVQVSGMKLDNEYDGPLLNERDNSWPASTQEKSDEDDI